MNKKDNTKKIIIYGAGGHGKVIADITRNNKNFEILGFIDDNKEKKKTILGYPILGTRKNLFSLQQKGYKQIVIAIGDNKIRRKIARKLKKQGFIFPSLLHPEATVASDVKIGKGTVIMAGAVINSGTKIGDHVIINTGATVDHDNWVRSGAHIAPGVHLGGGVKVGEKTLIGIGAGVRECCSIGSNCIVGMGATVVNDVSNNTKVVGTPAKPMKK